MSTDSRHVIAIFKEATDTANAIDALTESGIEDQDILVITGVPYPERALGRHTEWLRLPHIVLAGAAGGMVFGLFLAVITPHLYRLDVGGHPTVGFPPSAVIVFVFTMMATIISTFLGVLWEMGFPEFGPKYYHRLVTDGYLAVKVEILPEEEANVERIMKEHEAHLVERAERMPL